MLLSVQSRHYKNRYFSLSFTVCLTVLCLVVWKVFQLNLTYGSRWGCRENYYWSAVLRELTNGSRRSIWCIWLFVANYCKQVKQIWKIIFEGMWPRIFIGITRTPEKCLLSLYHDCTFKNWRGGLFVFTVLGLLCREKLEQLCFCFMQMEIQRSVIMAQQTIHSWRLAGEWCTPRFSRLWKVPVLCQ